MTDDITLDFIGAQLQRVLDDNAVFRSELADIRGEIAGFRDDMRVLTAMTMRIDNKLNRLEDEIHRFGDRVRKLEEARP
jgi:predicted nuclease with TOPRIM domain